MKARIILVVDAKLDDVDTVDEHVARPLLGALLASPTITAAYLDEVSTA